MSRKDDDAVDRHFEVSRSGYYAWLATAGCIQPAPRLDVRVKRDYASATANGKVGAGAPEMQLEVPTGRIVVQ